MNNCITHLMKFEILECAGDVETHFHSLEVSMRRDQSGTVISGENNLLKD